MLLKCSNGETLSVSQDTVLVMGTIQTMLQSLPDTSRHETIPLPTVTRSTLTLLVSCIEGKQPEFRLRKLNVDDLCKLWIASDFLDASDVKAKCQQEVATRIKSCRSVEELRLKFKMCV